MNENTGELTTRAGVVLTSAYEAELAAEAEQGFDTTTLVRRPVGRAAGGAPADDPLASAVGRRPPGPAPTLEDL